LPEEFGRIYLGETFSAYVSVVNSLPGPVIIATAEASLKSSRGVEVNGRRRRMVMRMMRMMMMMVVAAMTTMANVDAGDDKTIITNSKHQ
jgi:hypothetical protein